MAAKPREAYTTVSVKPLSGVLDTRSEPEDVALGAWRFKQNFILKDGTKLCIRPQWAKLFGDRTPYANYDYHDQGTIDNTSPTPEYVTLLFEATSNSGGRGLYLGTQSRIAFLNEDSGLWTTILTGMGGASQTGLPQVRFKAAELQEVILFTNNVDPVQATTIGTTSIGTISDLGTLGISKAGVVTEFGGFMLLMNVVESGARKSSRIWWSDFNLPLKYGIQADSLSNFQDLDYGATIIASIPMAGALYIFTTESIWRCTLTGDDKVFAFVKVYSEPLNHAKCLVYPNTLVSTGNECWYASQEAIYRFDPYIPEPVRDEWLFRGGAIMFSDQSALDPTCCQSPVAQVNPLTQEVWVSWPELSSLPSAGCVNSKTLVFNYKYQSPDIVDFGFSSFVNFEPTVPAGSACLNTAPLFIGASIQDKSLKQIGDVFSRERLANTGKGTVTDGNYVPWTGQYVVEGFTPLLRALLPLVNFDRDKLLTKVLLENQPSVSPVENVVKLRIGNTFSESDPNLPNGLCSVLWHPQKDLPLKCLDTMTASKYVAANIRRDSGMEWNCYVQGRFLYVEFTLAQKNGAPFMGMSACFHRMELQVQMQPKTD